MLGLDPHQVYLRPLPTADLNGTLGLSFGVLLLMIYYGIKIKGLGGFVHELFTAPFGAHPLLWPFNFLLNLIEYLAKFVSLGMRLFGNMYAGELLFFLIALLGGTWAFSTDGSILLALGHVIAGTGWLAVPHSDRHTSGLHLHDADARVYRAGARRPLIGFSFVPRFISTRS